MQQIYRRENMPKCDFDKVAKHLWTATSENRKGKQIFSVITSANISETI